MNVVGLPHGMQLIKECALGITVALQYLVSNREKQALQELHQVSEGARTQVINNLSMLASLGLCDLNGTVSPLVRVAVYSLLEKTEQGYKLAEIFRRCPNEIELSVESLTQYELAALVVAVSVDMQANIEHVMGYSKISAYCTNGVSSQELINAIHVAAHYRLD